MSADAFLEVRNIQKSFNGHLALSKANLMVRRGEIHALIGENGSGKTTLTNILGGVIQPNKGKIFIGGKRVRIESVRDAMDLGIATVFQNDSLFDNLDIAANIFANREIKTRWGRIDWKEIYKRSEEVLHYLSINVSSKTMVSRLTTAERKMVEIARAVISEAAIVILDEPTVSFQDEEIAKLFEVMRHLKESDVAIIYISHRLNEISDIADQVTVLREGIDVATYTRDEFKKINIFEIMVGEKISDRFPKISVDIKEDILIVHKITTRYLKDLSFNLRKGEILGIAGLKGAGRTSLARALFGLDRIESGSMYIQGRKIRLRNTEHARKCGISFLPADRLVKGLALSADIVENTTISSLKTNSSTKSLIDSRWKKSITQQCKEMLGIHYVSAEDPVRNLSGGNQKKVMISKWILCNSRVIILNEPTSSMDLASKVDIYNILNDLVSKGVAIILISSELPELLGMCDRIIVMRKTKIAAVFKRDQATQEKILEVAMATR